VWVSVEQRVEGMRCSAEIPFKKQEKMGLTEILRDNRELILDKWFRMMIDTYPEDGRAHFLANKDRFTNPLGATLTDGAEALIDCLLQGGDPESDRLFEPLERMMKLRAVQDFTASEAVKCVFFLKGIIRDLSKPSRMKSDEFEQLLAVDDSVDRLALKAFDLYMQARERIYQMKATELRNRTSRILERACNIWDQRGESAPEDFRQD
jgi:hypothetical protein